MYTFTHSVQPRRECVKEVVYRFSFPGGTCQAGMSPNSMQQKMLWPAASATKIFRHRKWNGLVWSIAAERQEMLRFRVFPGENPRKTLSLKCSSTRRSSKGFRDKSGTHLLLFCTSPRGAL